MRLVIVAMLVSSVAVAIAQPLEQTAADHHKHGKELFKAKDYAGAATEFAQAYAYDPLPKYLFNLAQAQRFDGDCKAAIDSYQKFLDTGPDKDDVEFAKTGIETCKKALPAAPVAVCGDGALVAPEGCDDGRTDDGDGCSATCAVEAGWICTGAPSACGHAPIPQQPEDDQPITTSQVYVRRPRDSRFGKVLIGASAGLAVASGTFYFLARRAAGHTDDPQPIGDYNDAVDRAKRYRGFTLITGGLSAAAAIGAVIYYATRTDHDLVLEPAAGGGAKVLVGGRF